MYLGQIIMGAISCNTVAKLVHKGGQKGPIWTHRGTKGSIGGPLVAKEGHGCHIGILGVQRQSTIKVAHWCPWGPKGGHVETIGGNFGGKGGQREPQGAIDASKGTILWS